MMQAPFGSSSARFGAGPLLDCSVQRAPVFPASSRPRTPGRGVIRVASGFRLEQPRPPAASGDGAFVLPCMICRERTAVDTSVIRLSCGCSAHLSCIAQYVQNKITDRFSVSQHGIACPNGLECLRSRELMSLPDLRRIAALSGSEPRATTTLSHEQVSDLEALMVAREHLEALRTLTGNARIGQDEVQSLMRLGEARCRGFATLLTAGDGGGEGAAVRGTTRLTRAVGAIRRRLLTAPRFAGHDQYAVETSKACPHCGARGTHYHGHQCHNIHACPVCQQAYCFKCASAAAAQPRPCLCGGHTFCEPIRSTADAHQHLSYSMGGVPFDRRCQCVVCPQCRFMEPCADCPGDCLVCRGVVPPGPLGLDSGWRPLPVEGVRAGLGALEEMDVPPGYNFAEPPLYLPRWPNYRIRGARDWLLRGGAPWCDRLWDACRGVWAGDVPVPAFAGAGAEAEADRAAAAVSALIAEATEQGGAEAVAALVNSRDRDGRTCLFNAAVTGQLGVFEALLAAPSIQVASTYARLMPSEQQAAAAPPPMIPHCRAMLDQLIAHADASVSLPLCQEVFLNPFARWHASSLGLTDTAQLLAEARRRYWGV